MSSVRDSQGVRQGHPTAFVSYAHESAEHAKRVFEFTNQLREGGLDAILDQFIAQPPEGWIDWMSSQLRSADYIIVVCTAAWLRRVNGEEEPGRGYGVRWEGRLIKQSLYVHADHRKIVPVFRGSREFIPDEFAGCSSFDMDLADAPSRVLDHIAGIPPGKAAPLGPPLMLRDAAWTNSPPTTGGGPESALSSPAPDNMRNLVCVSLDGRNTHGLGCVIAPNRVLTAREFLNSSGAAPDRLSVRRPGDPINDWRRASIEWDAEAEGLDVAVLAVSELALPGVATRFHRTAADSGRPWKAVRLDAPGEAMPNPALEAIRGTQCSRGQGGILLDLDSEGVSAIGSPVFDGRTYGLLGIVGLSHADPTKRLLATPCDSFMALEAFVAAMGIDVQKRRGFVEWTTKAIVGSLEDTAVRLSVASAVDTDGSTDWAPRRLAGCLLGMPIESSMVVLFKAFQDAPNEARARIRDIARFALPTYPELLSSTAALYDRELSGAPSDAASEAFAELLFAAADHRPCMFHYNVDRNRLHGKAMWRVTSGSAGQAEIGVDPDGEQMFAAICRYIGGNLGVEHRPDVIDEMLRLRRESDRERPADFLVLAHEPDDEQHVMAIVARVRAEIPELRVIVLGSGDQRDAYETRVLGLMIRMYQGLIDVEERPL